jgi:hypothetical protein
MRLIKRVIPERHVQSVIGGALYFSPCRTFVDLLEFRFGYCWDQFERAQAENKPEILERCIQKTFNDDYVQERINNTVISCWSYNHESPYMWETYAHSEAAILVTVLEDELSKLVRQQYGEDSSSGPVRYNFQTSHVRPEFITSTHDPQWNKDFDLFFHKHEFYGFENEYRAVIFGQSKAVKMNIPNSMVQEITLSPCAFLDRSLLAALQKEFGDRVQESRLRWTLDPQKVLSFDEYMADEKQPKNSQVQKLFEEWKRLGSQSSSTKGWNDPKAPPIPKEQFRITKQIHEVEQKLRRAIEELKKSPFTNLTP